MSVTNPPGRNAINYRDGTHTTILRRMLAALGDRSRPGQPLAKLVARTTDDAGVALLDAWATVADVVTFYQERIANEGYLRTATQRASVLELARAIGYELRPGAASTTYLDFQVETAPGAPTSALVARGTRVRSVPGQDESPQVFETADDLVADVASNEVPLRRYETQTLTGETTWADLAGTTTGLRVGDPLLIVYADSSSSRTKAAFRTVRAVEPHPATGELDWARTRVTWDARLSEPELPIPEELEGIASGVYALRLTSPVFGHNAPDWRAVGDEVRKRYMSAPSGDEWPNPASVASGPVDLAGEYPDLAPGSLIVLTDPDSMAEAKTRLFQVTEVEVLDRTGYAISGRVTQVTCNPSSVPPIVPTPRPKSSDFGMRTTMVYNGSEPLELAQSPITDPVTGPTLDLDRAAPLQPEQVVLVTGTDGGGNASVQAARIVSVHLPVDPAPGPPSITLEAALDPPLTVDSVRVHGNVVAATHGETVAGEVLGSGDGTVTHQRFQLRKSNLTHVTAPTSSGVVDTLEIRVDEVLWAETPSLYLAGHHDRAYIVRIDDEARASVIFGDGERGSRLPTGQENVVATYRSGLGPAGDVAAGSLTLLPQRPLGISTVTNPIRASGGTAPETLAGARVNAPLAVLTLDRVVSLSDYEDYTRAYGGIAKARAVSLLVGAIPLVHLTVAGPGGAEVGPITLENLLGALETVRDTTLAVQVDTYRKTMVAIEGELLACPEYKLGDVQARVLAALTDAYTVERRSFAQPVTAAEVLTIIHGVAGVAGARLTALHRGALDGGGDGDGGDDGGGDGGVAEVIAARDAHVESGGVVPAELIVSDASHIRFAEEMAS